MKDYMSKDSTIFDLIDLVQRTISDQVEGVVEYGEETGPELDDFSFKGYAMFHVVRPVKETFVYYVLIYSQKYSHQVLVEIGLGYTKINGASYYPNSKDETLKDGLSDPVDRLVITELLNSDRRILPLRD